MEPRFGYDFSRVRVHKDSKAAESAQAVNALAYTVGQDVVLGTGQFAPATSAELRLLAHELVHTIQQGSAANKHESLSLAPPSDSFEQEADISADSVMRGLVPEIGRCGTFRIARKPCLPRSACKSPIPGSAGDFHERVLESQTDAIESARSSGATAKTKPAPEITKYAKRKLPTLMQSLTGIKVNPVIGEKLSAQFIPQEDEFQGSTKKLGHMEIPEQLEKEAKEYNNPKALSIGGKTRAEWETNVAMLLTHEVAHARFAVKTPKGLWFRGEQSLTELEELDAILSEFPIAYRHIVSSSGSGDKKKTELEKYITAWVENKDEGIRGIIHKLRCLLPCEKVAKSVWIIFSKQAAAWDHEMKSAILMELNTLMKDWPISVSGMPETKH